MQIGKNNLLLSQLNSATVTVVVVVSSISSFAP